MIAHHCPGYCPSPDDVSDIVPPAAKRNPRQSKIPQANDTALELTQTHSQIGDHIAKNRVGAQLGDQRIRFERFERREDCALERSLVCLVPPHRGEAGR